jgi:hypothetical protein
MLSEGSILRGDSLRLTMNHKQQTISDEPQAPNLLVHCPLFLIHSSLRKFGTTPVGKKIMTSQKRCGGDRSSALLEFVELLGLDSSNPTNVFLKSLLMHPHYIAFRNIRKNDDESAIV